MTNKIIGTIAVVALLLGIFASYELWSTAHPSTAFGSLGVKLAENYDPYIRYNGGYYSLLPINTAGTLQVGANGTAIPKLIASTCSLIASTFTVTASTSVAMDCAVTGVVSSDAPVLGMFATSTPSTAGPGWEITRASASSTAGFITFSVTNGTGATAVIPASLASSTQYVVY